MSPGPPADLTFYQVAAPIFVVLLLTGVAAEIREMRGKGEEATGESSREISWQYSLAIASVLAALLAGELLSLIVLLWPPPSDLEKIAVSVCLAVSVLGVPTLVVLAIWEERLRRLRRSLLAVFAALATVLVVAGITLAAVAVTNSPAEHTYHVYGTCASGECGLRERSAPSISSRSLGKLRDGDEVSIVCQTIGTEVPDPKGGSSVVWDRLSSGRYVTDVYIDTPPVSSEIAICADQAEAGAPRG